MISTYLVQRLEKPYAEDRRERGIAMDKAFGGGMLQLKDEAWKILYQIFRIAYMGSAEFEFGILPRVLTELINDKNELEPFTFVLQAKEIKANYKREADAQKRRRIELKQCKLEGKKPPRAKKVLPDVAEVPVYVICRKTQKEEVIERIKLLAKDEIRLKGSSNFSYALDPTDDYDKRTCGWLELDNGFFFFLDKTMWERTIELLTQ